MKSMTGFGRAKLEKNDRIYNIEIKSVNHKYSDISVKLPKSLIYVEDKIKKQISLKIARGKIDVFVSFENYSAKGKDIIVNEELVKKYLEKFKLLAEQNNLSQEIPVAEIIKLPEVLTIKETEDEEDAIQSELLECLEQGINNFVEMREAEANKIKEDLEARINDVEQSVQKISTYSTRLVEEYVVKLEERIKEILKTDVIDEARLAMEVVLYADKCSVEEELTRLKSHIDHTMGSKSGSLEITNLVVDIKTKLEDIREQIQNIE